MEDTLNIATELLERASDLLADLDSADTEFNTESWSLAEEIQQFLETL